MVRDAFLKKEVKAKAKVGAGAGCVSLHAYVTYVKDAMSPSSMTMWSEAIYSTADIIQHYQYAAVSIIGQILSHCNGSQALMLYCMVVVLILLKMMETSSHEGN